LIWSK